MTSQSLPLISDLERVFKEELALYELYAEKMRSDADLMVKLKIADLEVSNKEKNTILLQIQTLDASRQNLVRQIASVHGLSMDNIRISDICGKLSKAEASRLLTLKDRLQSVIESLRSAQDKTQSLAGASLGWINGTLNSLKSLLSPVPTYNVQGKVDHPGTFSGRVVARQV